jgi:hypothetical protein
MSLGKYLQEIEPRYLKSEVSLIGVLFGVEVLFEFWMRGVQPGEVAQDPVMS